VIETGFIWLIPLIRIGEPSLGEPAELQCGFTSALRDSGAVGQIPAPGNLLPLTQPNAGCLDHGETPSLPGVLKVRRAGFQPQQLPSIGAVTVEGSVNLQAAAEFARASRDPMIGLLHYLQPPDQHSRGIALSMGHYIQTVEW
jgi:hypothetical protein